MCKLSVLVQVNMGFAGCVVWAMFVLVVFIMNVAMGVNERLMDMNVSVLLAQEKPDPHNHCD